MSGPEGSGHLSDAELSELLDGVGSASSADHAASCPACTARLDGWRLTAERLRSPLSPPAGRREDAVAAAMAAWEAGDGGHAAVASAGGAAVASAGGAAVASAGAPDVASAAPGRRRLRVLSGLAAAAAVVVLAGVGLSQAGGSGGAHISSSSPGSTVGSTAAGAGPASASASRSDSAAAKLPMLSAPSHATANFDLGQVSGPAALVAALERVLPTAQSATKGVTSGSGSAAPVSGGVAPPVAASVGSTTTVPASGGVVFGASATTVGNAGASSGAADAVSPTSGLNPLCQVPPSILGQGAAPHLVVEGVAVYQSVPAEVYVYQLSTGNRAVVVDRASCRVLAEVSL